MRRIAEIPDAQERKCRQSAENLTGSKTGLFVKLRLQGELFYLRGEDGQSHENQKYERTCKQENILAGRLKSRGAETERTIGSPHLPRQVGGQP